MGYKPTIIVVDDSEIFLMYISIFLNRMNFEVVPVKSGLDLLRISKIVRPDIIMLDVQMPEMDGFKTLRHVKNDKDLAEVPVIMVSSDNERETQEACYRTGCIGYLTKPIKINDINSAFQSLNIANRGQRKFLRASFDRAISMNHNGETGVYHAETISERGIYIRKKEPLPAGTEVEVILPLDKESLSAKGTVIYSKGLLGEKFSLPPGVAIQFKDLTTRDEALLSSYITNLLIGDIIMEQEEAVIAASGKDY